MKEFLIKLFFGETMQDIKKGYNKMKKQNKEIYTELLKERNNLIAMQERIDERLNHLVSIIGTISHNQAREEFFKLKKQKMNKEDMWKEMEHYFDLDKTIKEGI